MRKYFAYIDESLDQRFPKGETMVQSSPFRHSSKGQWNTMEVMNNKTGNIIRACVTIGLGHHDFKDQEDYEKTAHNVIRQKKQAVGIKEDVNKNG